MASKQASDIEECLELQTAAAVSSSSSGKSLNIETLAHESDPKKIVSALITKFKCAKVTKEQIAEVMNFTKNQKDLMLYFWNAVQDKKIIYLGDQIIFTYFTTRTDKDAIHQFIDRELKKKFTLGEDYFEIDKNHESVQHYDASYRYTNLSSDKKVTKGGRNKKLYAVTCECFEHLLLNAGTKIGGETRAYFQALKRMIDVMQLYDTACREKAKIEYINLDKMPMSPRNMTEIADSSKVKKESDNAGVVIRDASDNENTVSMALLNYAISDTSIDSEEKKKLRAIFVAKAMHQMDLEFQKKNEKYSRENEKMSLANDELRLRNEKLRLENQAAVIKFQNHVKRDAEREIARLTNTEALDDRDEIRRNGELEYYQRILRNCQIINNTIHSHNFHTTHSGLIANTNQPLAIENGSADTNVTTDTLPPLPAPALKQEITFESVGEKFGYARSWCQKHCIAIGREAAKLYRDAHAGRNPPKHKAIIGGKSVPGVNTYYEEDEAIVKRAIKIVARRCRCRPTVRNAANVNTDATESDTANSAPALESDTEQEDITDSNTE